MERFESIIGSLYEAAAGQESWYTVLDELSAATRSRGSVLISITDRGRLLGFSDSVAETADTYVAEKWYLLDERYKGVPAIRTHGVAVDHDFTSDEEIAKSQYYQDFAIKRGIPWWAGLHLPTDKGIWCLSSFRTSEQGPCDLVDKSLLLRFKPHLSRALTLYRVVQEANTGAVLAILEKMSTASFAFAANGKVVAFNALAQRLLDDGLAITKDCLYAANAADDLCLQELISLSLAKHSYANQVPAVVTVRRVGKRPLVVKMISLADRLRSAFGGLAAIALVTDPHAKAPSDEAMLRAIFNLTAAEAKLAARIAAGVSVREAARSLAIEESTARQYAKQVMAKSETHRQGEFVALATRLLHPVVRHDSLTDGGD